MTISELSQPTAIWGKWKRKNHQKVTKTIWSCHVIQHVTCRQQRENSTADRKKYDWKLGK